MASIRFKAVLAAISAVLALFSAGAQSGALTATATAQGFTLSTFVDQVPTTGFCCGPLGTVNTPSGILVSSYAGDLRSFTNGDNQHWSASPTVAGAAYGGSRPAGLTSLGGRFYLTLQSGSKVVEVTAAGAFVQDIVGIGNATGIVGNETNGLLYVSTGSQIYAVNPVSKTSTLFNNAGADGLTMSADGHTLFAEAGGHIFGYDTTSKAQVFDSGPVAGGPDGTAFGSGDLAGNIFVNTNNGDLVQINLTTLAQTLLYTGGSRGDFVSVDASNGTLLFTQTDAVLRLTAPGGACFGNACNNVPLPSTLLLLAMGALVVGLGRQSRQPS